MKLKQRSYKKELLDQDDVPFEAIKRNMQELNVINSWLGGHRITVNGFKHLAAGKKDVTVCEIGCGGGDNLVALLHWCGKNAVRANFIGIDIKKECIAFARQNGKLEGNTFWIHNDYRNTRLERKPDIIFSSLFCHHFTEEELVGQVQWMRDNSLCGFFINDLHRHLIAYHAIRSLTRLFSHSYLVRNDAPLSVARGFRKREWQKIFQAAGITQYSVSWQWAFRYLITYRHG